MTQIHEGKAIEQWRAGAKQSADAPTADTTRPVKDPYWNAITPLLDKGAKVSTGTKRALTSVETITGTLAPTAEHAYKAQAAALQHRQSDAAADDVVKTVELGRKGGTMTDLIQVLGSDTQKELAQEVEHLERVRQAASRAITVSRRELHREAANDPKLQESMQHVWAEAVAYGDRIDNKTTLLKAKVWEEDALEVIALTAEAESQRSAILGNTQEVAKLTRQAIQKVAELDPLDRPNTFPTAEAIAARFQSQRKEDVVKSDPRKMRSDARKAKREAEAELDKFYLTDEQRAAVEAKEAARAESNTKVSATAD